jgi:hypothetical protein
MTLDYVFQTSSREVTKHFNDMVFDTNSKKCKVSEAQVLESIINYDATSKGRKLLHLAQVIRKTNNCIWQKQSKNKP